MKKVINRLRLALLITIIAVPTFLTAQTPPPPGSGDPDDPNNVPDVPIPFDGGVSLLVAAGVAYGLKKVHERKKAEKL